MPQEFDPRGRVMMQKSFTVWCRRCGTREGPWIAKTRRHAEGIFQNLRWRRVARLGWLCPNCREQAGEGPARKERWK